MKLVLGISTSTPRGSVALVGAGRVLGLATHEVLEAHAEALFSLIDEALAQAGASRKDLCGVACDVGPGSFTGVRVGVASAAGVAAALGLETVSVGSLESMVHAALRARPDERVARVVAVLDAKKGEVYLGSYDRAGHPLAPSRHLSRAEAQVELEAWAAEADTRIVGAVALELGSLGTSPAIVRAPAADLPCASSVALVGEAWLSEKRALGPLKPVYVREPDAKPSFGPAIPR